VKVVQVAALAIAGMLVTAGAVYSLTPSGGAAVAGGDLDEPRDPGPDSVSGGPESAPVLSQFSAGSTIHVDGRMGHARLARASRGETFVLLEVRGAAEAKAKPPVHLSLVIDRSGSMKGTRLDNAVRAATGAVSRLNEGDMVSVVTFDTRTQLVVPPTTIGPGSRESIASAIRGITLGGDTCISCGVEEGIAGLLSSPEKLSKMILLSDGDANHGVRDIPGFRSIAQRARDKGIGITTIGVDVDYNPRLLSAISEESNGRHYFVENDSALVKIFEAEAEEIGQAVASGVEASIDLGPGVELDRVLDRSFRRAGDRVVVPLGAFSKGDVKTVLLKVRVPSQTEGEVRVADVLLTYRDLAAGGDGTCEGKLGVTIAPSGEAASDLDAVVSGRVQRSETAAALEEASHLFEQGKVTEARRRLASQEQSLQAAAAGAKKSPDKARGEEIEDDLERQIAVVKDANTGFATPPQPAPQQGPVFAEPPPGVPGPVAAAPIPPQATRDGKRTVRKAEESADAFKK
jgi:Ca-activated chloride channel family protein